MSQHHSGFGDNIAGNKIINVYSGKESKYHEIKNRILELKADLQNNNLEEYWRNQKTKELNKKEEELAIFKQEIEKLYFSFSIKEREDFISYVGQEPYKDLDRFFAELKKIKEKNNRTNVILLAIAILGMVMILIFMNVYKSFAKKGNLTENIIIDGWSENKANRIIQKILNENSPADTRIFHDSIQYFWLQYQQESKWIGVSFSREEIGRPGQCHLSFFEFVRDLNDFYKLVNVNLWAYSGGEYGICPELEDVDLFLINSSQYAFGISKYYEFSDTELSKKSIIAIFDGYAKEVFAYEKYMLVHCGGLYDCPDDKDTLSLIKTNFDLMEKEVGFYDIKLTQTGFEPDTSALPLAPSWIREEYINSGKKMDYEAAFEIGLGYFPHAPIERTEIYQFNGQEYVLKENK